MAVKILRGNSTTRASSQRVLEDGQPLYEKDTNMEVPNNSNPSKRQILYSALEDLGGDVSSGNTLYQLEHKLEKILVSRK